MKRSFPRNHFLRTALAALALAPWLPACTSSEGMVEVAANVTYGTVKFSIDSYEGSLKDKRIKVNGATQTVKVAASRPARAPEKGVTYSQAKQYCKDAGKRLCTTKEWKAACTGAQNVTTGGTTLTSCNISTNSSSDGSDSAARNTGVSRDCNNGGAQIFDMIGNVSEWTTGTSSGYTYGIAMGPNFRTSSFYINCSYIADIDYIDNTGVEDDISFETTNDRIGFRCCK